MRSPHEVAAEARQHLDQANTAFVPTNLVKLAELSVEFMESTAAVLAASGLIPSTAPVPTSPQ